MKKAFSILTLLSGGLLWAQSEAPLALTLGEAQKYALENSYELRNQQLEYEKARQTIRETAAIGLPQLSAVWDYQWQPKIPAQPIDIGGEIQTVAFGVSHTNRATISASQLILDASYFVALQATRVLRNTVNLQKESTELDVRKNVAQSYYGVLVSEELARLLEENLATLQKQLKETRALYETGFVEEQDADQLEILVNTLQNNLQRARRQMELATRLLKFNMGMPGEQAIALSNTLDDLLLTQEAAETLALRPFNYQEHIDYRAILSQEEGARLQVRNQTMQYLPTITSFFQLQQSHFQNEFEDAFAFQGDNVNWIRSSALGISINWNLFTGMRRDALRQTALLDLQRVNVAKEATANELQLTFEQARSDYLTALDQFQTDKRNMELARKIRDRTRIKYTEGINSSLDLTQVENQYLQSEQTYIQSLQQLLNAREELNNALGK